MSDTTPADVGTDATTPIISVRPVTLAAPNRGQDLRVRVSAPTTGRDLPVVVTYTMLAVATYIVASLLIDLAIVAIDPRLRHA